MLFWVLACTSSPDDGVTDDTSTPPHQLTTALGTGEGVLDPALANWTAILGEDDGATDPRDLGFDTSGNLWVANRVNDHTLIVSDPGSDSRTVDDRIDGYALHFMEETAAFAFEDETGAEQFGPEFGSCGESENTYNDTQRADGFMGPVLWSTDLDIFAEANPFGLGSHLDMQHESPDCVGIAWEKDNVYWVFDGFHDAIVRYDFEENHGVGQDDHSDGIVYRLTEPEVTRVENAPGHMAIDPSSGRLYVADTGGGRVLWLDTATGTQGANLAQQYESIATYAQWDGVTWGELVTGLDRPGGLALDDQGRLFVAEYGTGVIHAYDADPEHVAPADSDTAATDSLYGAEIQSLDAQWGSGALYGIEVGPDGALWVIDNAAPAVYRLTPP
jgi:sugar lactone lactonase YvrE